MPRTWLWLCLICAWFSTAESQGAQTYPLIGPLHQTFDVPNVNEANVSLVIKSRDGVPLYKLQCHSAGYTGDPDFDYSGDFECRLSLIGKPNSYSTLLTEDIHQSRDWESRGRFFAADLQSPCDKVPEFGSVRTFKLRGMKLILKIIDPHFTPEGKLNALKLVVSTQPDASAQRPIADIVPIPRTGIPHQCKLRQYFVDSAAMGKRQQPN